MRHKFSRLLNVLQVLLLALMPLEDHGYVELDNTVHTQHKALKKVVRPPPFTIPTKNKPLTIVKTSYIIQ